MHPPKEKQGTGLSLPPVSFFQISEYPDKCDNRRDGEYDLGCRLRIGESVERPEIIPDIQGWNF